MNPLQLLPRKLQLHGARILTSLFDSVRTRDGNDGAPVEPIVRPVAKPAFLPVKEHHLQRGPVPRAGRGLPPHLAQLEQQPRTRPRVVGPDKVLDSKLGVEVGTENDCPVDVANYYDGQPSALFCGLFDYYGVPQKTFYAFKAFRELLDCPERVKVEVSPSAKGVYGLAAVNRSVQEAAILVSNFGRADGVCSISLYNLPAGKSPICEIYLLDRDHDLALIKAERIEGDDAIIDIFLSKHSVALIKLR